MTAVLCCWTRQHEPFMLIPGNPHFRPIPRQQVCWPDGCEVSPIVAVGVSTGKRSRGWELGCAWFVANSDL